MLHDVLRVFNEAGQVRILQAFTPNEEIFRGFLLELVKAKTALRQPYAGLRVQSSTCPMCCVRPNTCPAGYYILPRVSTCG
jgi:hypothetical protein